jgi:hypothetical protein
VACTESNINEISSPANTKRIYASISDIEGDFDAETRVELNESKQTVWTENDDIYIFEDGYIYVYTFDGKTGDRSGSFSHTRSYSYQPFGAIFDKYYAVHLADLMIASFNDNTPAFFTILPAEQHYKSHSYGVNTNAMLGSSTNGVDFEFKNLYGYLRLALTGNKVVKNIIIEGNNNETLAAQIYINREGNFGIHDEAPTSTTITLNCGNGVQLTDTPTEFYFTILPTTFQNGIFREPIPFGAGIGSADTAIQTIVFTVIGKFDQTADKDFIAEFLLCDFFCMAGGKPFVCTARDASRICGEPAAAVEGCRI